MSDPGTSAPMAPVTLSQVISNTDRQAAVDTIVAAHGEAARNDATAGVKRVADRWSATDGDAAAFRALCEKHFVSDAALRTRLLARLEESLRQIGGHLYEMRRSLRRWNDLVGDECAGVDDVLASFDPAPDLSD